MGIFDSVILAEINMMYAGILGLVFILVVAFSVMAAKTWHWVNIVFLILTFMAGVGAITGLTTVYKLRTDAMKDARDATEDAERLEKAADFAVNGDPASPIYDPGSLRATSESVARLMYGRGRVWLGGQVTAEGENRVFTFTTPRTTDNADIALQDVVLFAFLESNAYPARYIGSVRVTVDTPQKVTLEPKALADPQEFNQPTGTWTLFEKMPQDRRGVFKQAIVSWVESQTDVPADIIAFVENLKDTNADLDISTFRSLLMSNFLQADQLGFDPNSLEYESLIDRYAFDGLSLGKIQNWIDRNPTGRKNPRYTPVPEEVFVKYRFDENSKNPILVDSDGQLEIEGTYSQLGLAVPVELKLGHPVNFMKDDEVLVDQPTADGYERNSETTIPPFATNQPVTEIDRLYFRQMRDFPYEFSDLRLQTQQVAEEAVRVAAANETKKLALADTQRQTVARAELIANNDSDLSNLKNDFQAVESLQKQLTGEIAGYQVTIQTLETQIDEAYQQIRSLALKLSRKAFVQN